MDEEKVFSVTWVTAITAKTQAEAIMKAKQMMLNPTGLQVTRVELPKQHDPETHCRHGMLWSAYCDWC